MLCARHLLLDHFFDVRVVERLARQLSQAVANALLRAVHLHRLIDALGARQRIQIRVGRAMILDHSPAELLHVVILRVGAGELAECDLGGLCE